MPLPGGATDKFGNRYEGRWTIHAMLAVMSERADSIRLEPPGMEGEGAEFWVRQGVQRIYHQVKRQHGAGGRWTLADLNTIGVLATFWTKLQDPAAGCVFVSSHAAYQLQELAERAQGAASYEEFEHTFLQAADPQAAFHNLRRYWNNCAPSDAYRALQRITVQTVGEHFLRTTVESLLVTQVEGDSATTADVLAQFALDSVHQELTALDIWQHLLRRGLHRCQWGADLSVLAAVEACNVRYLAAARDATIARQVIPRAEVDTIQAQLAPTTGKRGVLITGEAGVGKSGVLLQVGAALHDTGYPVLMFRLDRLEPTLLPREVGRQLGLPGSPADVLGAIAQGRDCTLIIDQLDAASLIAGRYPEFFECIDEIIQQVQAHPSMRLLLACRKFDLDNDPRLHGLTGQDGIASIVTVSHLNHAEVQQILTSLRRDVTRLSTGQLDLLTVPLHLRLFAEVATSTPGVALDFRTVTDLYDRFWDHKQQAINRARSGNPVQWTRVIDTLSTYMSTRQRLSAPVALVDEWAADAQVMASEQVLTQEGRQYSFFHEGFFDYAFARRFVAQDRALIDLLHQEGQDLFRRAQVRQILLYERNTDRERYLADLRALLTTDDIRFHLKVVVCALLAALSDPTVEEWQILRQLLEAPDTPLAGAVWRSLRGSPAWFALLDAHGAFAEWLAGADLRYINSAVWLLAGMQEHAADRIADLVMPYVGASDIWQRRLVYLMQIADLSAGRRFFDLFLSLIDAGMLDDESGSIATNASFWDFLVPLAEKQPAWACEAIAHWLHRLLLVGSTPDLDMILSSPGTNFILQIDDDRHVLRECAGRAPRAFVHEVLPPMIQIMEQTAIRDDRSLWYDIFCAYWSLGPVGDNLLSAMETALGTLAEDYPDDFALVATRLRSLSFRTAHYLLVRGYTANGVRFADEAADYLLAALQHIIVAGGIPIWALRLLLESITPHCSADRLTTLETAVWDYAAPRSRDPRERHRRRQDRCRLLEGIVAERRSARLAARLRACQHEFGSPPVTAPPPRQMELAAYLSPIPEEEARLLTDAEWVQAVARYGSPDTTGIRQDGRLVGGADELANVLAARAQAEPTRFAALIDQFAPTTHPAYFRAALRGLAKAGLELETLIQVCQQCHQLPGRPCGYEIIDILTQLADHPLPEAALDMIAWYATEAPDPAPEEDIALRSGRDLLTAAINSVRGRAAETVGTLIAYDGRRLAHFLPALERMVADPSISVRVTVAAALTHVLEQDRDLAVRLFLRLCETDDRLLATHYVEAFLFYTLRTHYAVLRPLLERMLGSSQPEVARVGARQACRIALVVEEARPLVTQCLQSSPAHRQGAAEVFAANVTERDYRHSCEARLRELFQDPDETVRAEAARCFKHFREAELGAYETLITAFRESPAFATNHHYLLHALDQTTATLPATICRVCMRVLEVVGTSAGDLTTAGAASARRASQLLVRAYGQAGESSLREQCLDLLDIMLQRGVLGLEQDLAFYDR